MAIAHRDRASALLAAVDITSPSSSTGQSVCAELFSIVLGVGPGWPVGLAMGDVLGSAPADCVSGAGSDGVVRRSHEGVGVLVGCVGPEGHGGVCPFVSSI
jgi:hypothetical protein